MRVIFWPKVLAGGYNFPHPIWLPTAKFQFSDDSLNVIGVPALLRKFTSAICTPPAEHFSQLRALLFG